MVLLCYGVTLLLCYFVIVLLSYRFTLLSCYFVIVLLCYHVAPAIPWFLHSTCYSDKYWLGILCPFFISNIRSNCNKTDRIFGWIAVPNIRKGRISVAEPVLFGRSWCKGPAPGSGSTIDKSHKTVEILNDILFVSSHIDKSLFKKQILINK